MEIYGFSPRQSLVVVFLLHWVGPSQSVV